MLEEVVALRFQKMLFVPTCTSAKFGVLMTFGLGVGWEGHICPRVKFFGQIPRVKEV